MAQTSSVYRTVLVTLLSLATAATAAAQVSGSGTPGRVTKWTGTTTVGNSGITESVGRVGIGTTVPLEKVHVEGTGVVRARIGSDTNAGIRLALQGTPEWSVATVLSGFEFPTRNFQIYNERKGMNALLIDSNNLMIQTGAGLVAGGEIYPLADGGPSLGKSYRRWSEVWAKKGTISTSDARWKQDVTSLDDGLARVMKLRPVAFRWKDEPEGQLNLGLIAQEVEPILPEAVTHGSGPDEALGLNYSSLVPVVIRAVQEQQQVLEAKDAQIRDLSEKCSALLRQLEMAQQASSRLESRLAALEEQAETRSVLASY